MQLTNDFSTITAAPNVFKNPLALGLAGLGMFGGESSEAQTKTPPAKVQAPSKPEEKKPPGKDEVLENAVENREHRLVDPLVQQGSRQDTPELVALYDRVVQNLSGSQDPYEKGVLLGLELELISRLAFDDMALVARSRPDLKPFIGSVIQKKSAPYRPFHKYDDSASLKSSPSKYFLEFIPRPRDKGPIKKPHYPGFKIY